MTHQAEPASISSSAGPGAEVAQLRQVLGLVAELAGRPAAADDAGLEEAARISAAYARALPIVQRRFDRLAAETAAWAAAGAEALLLLQDRRRPVRAAAARLADSLAGALGRLAAVLPA